MCFIAIFPLRCDILCDRLPSFSVIFGNLIIPLGRSLLCTVEGPDKNLLKTLWFRPRESDKVVGGSIRRHCNMGGGRTVQAVVSIDQAHRVRCRALDTGCCHIDRFARYILIVAHGRYRQCVGRLCRLILRFDYNRDCFFLHCAVHSNRVALAWENTSSVDVDNGMFTIRYRSDLYGAGFGADVYRIILYICLEGWAQLTLTYRQIAQAGILISVFEIGNVLFRRNPNRQTR